jgi:glutaredoxin
MSTQVVVYTMKGCPYCVELKELLVKENIDFVDRDIDEHEEEYDVFSKVVENDYIPALLIINDGKEKLQSFLYAPERDYNELTEAVDLIKKHLI